MLLCRSQSDTRVSWVTRPNGTRRTAARIGGFYGMNILETILDRAARRDSGSFLYLLCVKFCTDLAWEGMVRVLNAKLKKSHSTSVAFGLKGKDTLYCK